MIDAEGAGMRGNPEHEAKAWLEKLSDTELSGIFSFRDGFYAENITSRPGARPVRSG